jgi:hypothetical protein
MEQFRNIVVANNKVISLSPYRRPMPEGKRHQFVAQVGNYPNVKLYIVSDFVYHDSHEARLFAERELIRRGFNPMKARIYTQRRNRSAV